MKHLLALMLATALPIAMAAPAYVPSGQCGGFPKLDVAVPAGHCLALVADSTLGLKFPRRILEVAPDRFWVIDMGSWEPRQGRLLELVLNDKAATPAERVRLTPLVGKLDRPLGLALGPDGKVYVAEAGRIWRTPVGVPVQEVVVDGLPDDGAHPLKEIAFAPGGRLFINVGSLTDACRNDAGKQARPCPETGGTRPRAAVWEAVLAGPSYTLKSLRPYATGLRNSVALAHVGDTLLQGENSIDYTDAGEPAEELNVLRDGGHYGWPYCVGARIEARGYEKRGECSSTEAPAQIWPAHAAPLQLWPVPAASPSPWAGQVLAVWHGHRPTGQRVMSFKVDAKGRPVSAPAQVVGGWAAKDGVRPRGAPTGVTVDHQGRLWIVEDRNKTITLVLPDKR